MTAFRLQNNVTETAAAKINLYLHVLGKRQDGYHELQSLVAFAGNGDRVTAAAADSWSLSIDGRFSGPLADEDINDNLILRAARRLMANDGRKAALTLTKNLPVASGIGGGSADAAAALRCLQRLFGVGFGDAAVWADLGADIPVCLLNRPALVEGMGEKLTTLDTLPALPAVLVNPGIPSSTGVVFKALARRFGERLPAPLPGPADSRNVETFGAWLAGSRNDLSAAAVEALPVVGDVLAALTIAPGSLLARMSGSGATCFALFPDSQTAAAAARWLADKAPEWWVQPAVLGGCP